MLERLFILKRTEIFRDLPESVLISLAEYLEDVHLEGGEVLFKQGDVSKSIYVVVSGAVRIHAGDATRTIMVPNDVFGERSALTGEVHSTSATAEEDTELLRLDEDLLYEVMAGNATISRSIIEVLLERFQ